MALTDAQRKALEKEEAAKNATQTKGDRRQRTEPGSTQDVPMGAIELITRQSQEQEFALAEESQYAVEDVDQDIESLDESADKLAMAKGFQKFLIVAGFSGRVDGYANQFLRQYNAMAIKPIENPFNTNVDIDGWTQKTLARSVPPLPRSLNGRQSAALPESQDKQS